MPWHDWTASATNDLLSQFSEPPSLLPSMIVSRLTQAAEVLGAYVPSMSGKIKPPAGPINLQPESREVKAESLQAHRDHIPEQKHDHAESEALPSSKPNSSHSVDLLASASLLTPAHFASGGPCPNPFLSAGSTHPAVGTHHPFAVPAAGREWQSPAGSGLHWPLQSLHLPVGPPTDPSPLQRLAAFSSTDASPLERFAAGMWLHPADRLLQSQVHLSPGHLTRSLPTYMGDVLAGHPLGHPPLPTHFSEGLAGRPFMPGQPASFPGAAPAARHRPGSLPGLGMSHFSPLLQQLPQQLPYQLLHQLPVQMHALGSPGLQPSKLLQGHPSPLVGDRAQAYHLSSAKKASGPAGSLDRDSISKHEAPPPHDRMSSWQQRSQQERFANKLDPHQLVAARSAFAPWPASRSAAPAPAAATAAPKTHPALNSEPCEPHPLVAAVEPQHGPVRDAQIAAPQGPTMKPEEIMHELRAAMDPPRTADRTQSAPSECPRHGSRLQNLLRQLSGSGPGPDAHGTGLAAVKGPSKRKLSSESDYESDHDLECLCPHSPPSSPPLASTHFSLTHSTLQQPAQSQVLPNVKNGHAVPQHLPEDEVIMSPEQRFHPIKNEHSHGHAAPATITEVTLTRQPSSKHTAADVDHPGNDRLRQASIAKQRLAECNMYSVSLEDRAYMRKASLQDRPAHAASLHAGHDGQPASQYMPLRHESALHDAALGAVPECKQPYPAHRQPLCMAATDAPGNFGTTTEPMAAIPANASDCDPRQTSDEAHRTLAAPSEGMHQKSKARKYRLLSDYDDDARVAFTPLTKPSTGPSDVGAGHLDASIRESAELLQQLQRGSYDEQLPACISRTMHQHASAKLDRANQSNSRAPVDGHLAGSQMGMTNQLRQECCVSPPETPILHDRDSDEERQCSSSDGTPPLGFHAKPPPRGHSMIDHHSVLLEGHKPEVPCGKRSVNLLRDRRSQQSCLTSVGTQTDSRKTAVVLGRRKRPFAGPSGCFGVAPPSWEMLASAPRVTVSAWQRAPRSLSPMPPLPKGCSNSGQGPKTVP